MDGETRYDDDDDFGGFAVALQPAFPLVHSSPAVSTSCCGELRRDCVTSYSTGDVSNVREPLGSHPSAMGPVG